MHHLQLKKKKEKLFVFFSKLGSLYNLSFTGHEILRDKIIGLDGPRRKLLIVEESLNKYNPLIIDLYEVCACTVKKIYSAINVGDLKNNTIEKYLITMALHFDFRNGNPPVMLPFYKNMTDSMHDIKRLETRTKHWERMLSKTLSTR
jgi:hypothetical protein